MLQNFLHHLGSGKVHSPAAAVELVDFLNLLSVLRTEELLFDLVRGIQRHIRYEDALGRLLLLW